MIEQVWSLVLDGQILGVRAVTSNEKYYDIDIDVYTKKLGLNPNNLQSLDLIEYDDLLMTEEEFYSGQLIEDASNDTKVLKAIKAFSLGNDPNDPKYKARKLKKIDDYKQKYYSYIPNKWLKEFAEYHFEHFEGRVNIYTSFTKPQRDFIKEYFRWRSRTLFNEQKAPKVLRKSVKKAKQLYDLMGDANDWYYDGTVDTGFKGGGHCELGHELRYEHYAVSPSTNGQIVFGSTCVSDFFEIDKEVLNNIMKAQETLLKEVKIIVFLMKTDKMEEYKAQYTDLWDIMKHFKGTFNDHLKNGSGWSRYMGGFDKLGLPLTRSMLLQYKELAAIYKEEQKDLAYHEHVKEVISDMRGFNYDPEVVHGIMHNSYKLKLAGYLRVCLMAKAYSFPLVTEGMFLVKDLLEAKEKLASLVTYVGNFTSRVTELYPFVYENGTRRLATRQEFVKSEPNVVRETYLSEYKTKQLTILLDEVFSLGVKPTRLIFTEVPEFVYPYNVKFLDNLPTLVNALKWSKESNFPKDIEFFTKPLILPKGEEPAKEVDKNSVTYKYTYIKENRETMTPAEARRFDRIPTHNLEESPEALFIINVYKRTLKRLGVADESTTPTPVEQPKTFGVNKVTGLTYALEEELNRILEAGASGQLPKSHFALTIIPTIKATGKISEKQRIYIDDALNKLDN